MLKKHIFLLFFLILFVGCDKKGQQESPPPPSSKKINVPQNGPIDTSLPGDPIAGARVYRRVCATCHGMDGRGNHGLTAADFLKESWRLKKDNKVLLNSIRNGVKEGSRVMPPQKGILTDKQIKDALSYVRQRFGQPAAQ